VKSYEKIKFVIFLEVKMLGVPDGVTK